MSEKIKDYQVIDVFCGGTFYKVKHKVTNNIFAWKAYDCSAYSDDQIQNVITEVKTISEVSTENLLQYYDTILHSPTKTLYVVLEYCSWRSVHDLIACCKATNKFIAEGFIWHLLLGLARACKALEGTHTLVLQKCISASSIYVKVETGELRINCFDLVCSQEVDLMGQAAELMSRLCSQPAASDYKLQKSHYSDDLMDVTSFLSDNRGSGLWPEVVLYHPTVLANQPNIISGNKRFTNILISFDHSSQASEANKCDSEKAEELCKPLQPLPRKYIQPIESPIYSNITPKWKLNKAIEVSSSSHNSMSPTLAALALELPGYMPRSRRPLSDTLDTYNSARQVSEDTLSQQWMSRLVALRQREDSLNKRERSIIAKEIVNSPSTKIIPLHESQHVCSSAIDGITLPPVVGHMRSGRGARRRRAGSVRRRRKSYGYEEMDSSLSADAGDGSMIVTAAKLTSANMPRRNIFPELSTKKVHFTSSNPFVESDDSVTLTFYELDNVDLDGYQVPRQPEDIVKFKYLNSEKISSDKRSAMCWSQSSPSKQARGTKNIFGDITNSNLSSIRKTPSKSSLSSKGSGSSRYSTASCRSDWGEALPLTPAPPPDVKKPKTRKSLLPFKTPFKFKTSTKV